MQEHLSSMRKTLGLILSIEKSNNTPTPQRGAEGLSAQQWGGGFGPSERSISGSLPTGQQKIQADATTQMAQIGQRPKKLQAWAGHEGSLVVPGSSLAPSHLSPAGDNPRRALQMVRGFPRSSFPAHASAERQSWHRYVILRNETIKFREDK